MLLYENICGCRGTLTFMSAVSTAAELGRALRARRISQGLTQQELAERAHVSRPWLVRLEGGHPSAELGLVIAVARALGLMLELADEPHPRSELDLDQVLDLTT